MFSEKIAVCTVYTYRKIACKCLKLYISSPKTSSLISEGNFLIILECGQHEEDFQKITFFSGRCLPHGTKFRPWIGCRWWAQKGRLSCPLPPTGYKWNQEYWGDQGWVKMITSNARKQFCTLITFYKRHCKISTSFAS